MKLIGKRIILRKPKPSDTKSLIKHINDFKVARYIFTIPHPYKLKDAKQFIEKLSKKEKHTFSIALKETDEVIGGISLRCEDPSKRATFGYWLGRKYWKQGITTEAAKLLLNFGFRKLKLKGICATVAGPNIASSNLLRKLGFKEEGRLRKHRKDKFSNKWLDELQFGLLKEEWKK